MTTVVHHIDHRNTADLLVKDKAEFVPDIIEERRKDSEGRITLNKFATGKLLGKGGFAKCYLGTHMMTNHQYALKIVSKSNLVKTKSKQKLQAEIKIHRVLRHNFVVKFERFFEDNNNVYMLLELCSNNSMSELLKRRKRLTEPEVRYYITQLISSLKYLHENLVIHRDLKLGNLFLDSQMRLKVGDFGLATKIADVNERRKTFCGTPNYIAPEILQGKNGHSFEVDVWSTGVIIYTLLVGKPPFESKDVESTYKRILANSFSFPETQQPVCEHAKSLIRGILQTKPSARPKLEAILDYAFFTRSSAYTPAQLPESALREPPSFGTQQRSTADSVRDKNLYSALDAPYGDENDPLNINRKKAQVTALRQKPFSVEQKDALGRPKMTTAAQGIFEEISKPPSYSAAELLKQAARSSSVPATSSAATVLPGVAPRAAPLSGPSSASAPPQKKERLASSATVAIDKRSYSSKFDIYQDSKSHLLASDVVPLSAPAFKQSVPVSRILHQASYPAEKPRDALIHSSKGVGAHRAYEQGPGSGARAVITSSSSAAPKVNSAYNEMDFLQTELEWFRLGNDQASQPFSGAQPSTAVPVATRHKPQTVEVVVNRRGAEAWSEDDHNVLQYFAAPPPIITPAYCSPPPNAGERSNPSDRALAPCSDSEPMHLSPPSDQILSSTEYKALGTLETMHEVLSSKGLDDLPLQGQAFEAGPARKIFHRPQSHSHHKANIWVVRYVDYTSKYGLGFLLNTGSAGVYFNDSTKIVVSPDGTVFQYSERRRKEKGCTSSEHSIQTHLVSKYPSELQKKVTLLRHFRNYLVDQQKEGASRGDDGSATGGREELENIAIAALEGASLGANSSIPIGSSSTVLRATDAMQMGCCCSPPGPGNSEGENPKMPFLKKWVRTRHAILFRLSNRTVQVLFFDRSEVLLSSEARMVTYVSKQNVRSEHSLEEVLQTGRTDIAKRLKYAKDIMYRLISTQAT